MTIEEKINAYLDLALADPAGIPTFPSTIAAFAYVGLGVAKLYAEQERRDELVAQANADSGGVFETVRVSKDAIVYEVVTTLLDIERRL